MKAKIIKYVNIYSTEGKKGLLHLLLWFIALTFWGYAATAFCEEKIGYAYDIRGRLITAWQKSGQSFHYTYDPAGNIITFDQLSREDQDGDFLPSNMENALSCPYIDDADSDDDGILDGLEDLNRNGTVDDGETDPCNLDTDNDGIQDGTELGYTEPVPDPDGAGPLKGTDTHIFQPDLDPGTTTHPLIKDTDTDGIDDGLEDTDHNGRMDAGESNPAVVLNRRIFGTIYAADGLPYTEPVTVKVYSGFSCSNLELEAAAWSSPDTGAYVFENLGKDTYYIFAQSSQTAVMGEWYSAAGGAPDCRQADQIVLAAVSEATGKDIYLKPASSIAGSVLESGGGVPAETGTIYIKAYAQNACTGSLLKSTAIDPSDGSFLLEGLSAGTYFILADTGTSNYQPEWWAPGKDAHDCMTAEAITVLSGAQVDAIDIPLDRGIRISGTIYQSNGTTAITGETIVIEAYTDDACTGNPFVSALINPATGTYTLSGLKPGSYFLKARDLGTAYIDEWWSEEGNAFNCLQAGSVAVADPVNMLDIDFQLDSGGVVSGTVFESDGETPVTDSMVIEVYSYSDTTTRACDTPLVTFTGLAADGSYHQALPAGRYYMRINPTGTAYAINWWNGSGGAISCEDASYTTVQEGITPSDKNFKLQPASAISGHIYQSDGVTPVADPVEIIAYSDDPCNAREVTRGSYDPDTGRYVIHNLGNSPYTIFVNAEGTVYADEWWSESGNAYFCFQTTHVQVTDNQDLTDRDILLDVGAHISGTVYQKDGVTPVDQAVPIGIYPENTCDYYRKIPTVTSDPVTGQYAFLRQGPGNYTLLADPEGSSPYLDEWWSESGDAFDCPDADVFSLASGVPQADKDFRLDLKATLAGTLYKPDGATMNLGFYVYLYPDDPCQGSSIDSVYSNRRNGTFSFQGLKPGQYHIFVDTRYYTYASEWFSQSGGAFSCDKASDIIVSSGEEITTLEIHMDLGATISGTLYMENGTTPVPETTAVRLYRGDPCDPEYLTYDNTSAGFFEIDALPPGTYYLMTQTDYYYDRWWSSSGTAQGCEDAQPIVIATAGDIIETTDFKLKDKASISGKVYELDGVTPVTGNMRIYLYKPNPPPANPTYVKYAAVSQDGSYSLRGIEAGTYLLRAYYSYIDYIPEWWSTAGDTFDVSEAESITLADGQQQNEINFSLHRKGEISGKVLNIEGSPITSEYLYVEFYAGESACAATSIGRSSVSSLDGSYTISRLDSEIYFLKTSSPYSDSSNYVHEWWSENGHTLDCLQAEGILVAVDQSIENKDFHLYDCANFPNKAVNDNFEQAIGLAGSFGSQAANNFCASAEDGEPDHSGWGGGAKSSLWWRWTATFSGTVIFDTKNSSFDTVLAVYQGDSVDALSLVEQNDNDDGPWSRVSFIVEEGQPYYIAVDTADSTQGTIGLSYQRKKALAGDINADEAVDIDDAILVLETLTQLKDICVPCIEGDASGDGRIGLEEAIFILEMQGKKDKE